MTTITITTTTTHNNNASNKVLLRAGATLLFSMMCSYSLAERTTLIHGNPKCLHQQDPNQQDLSAFRHLIFNTPWKIYNMDIWDLKLEDELSIKHSLQRVRCSDSIHRSTGNLIVGGFRGWLPGWLELPRSNVLLDDLVVWTNSTFQSPLHFNWVTPLAQAFYDIDCHCRSQLLGRS